MYQNFYFLDFLDLSSDFFSPEDLSDFDPFFSVLCLVVDGDRVFFSPSPVLELCEDFLDSKSPDLVARGDLESFGLSPFLSPDLALREDLPSFGLREAFTSFVLLDSLFLLPSVLPSLVFDLCSDFLSEEVFPDFWSEDLVFSEVLEELRGDFEDLPDFSAEDEALVLEEREEDPSDFPPSDFPPSDFFFSSDFLESLDLERWLRLLPWLPLVLLLLECPELFFFPPSLPSFFPSSLPFFSLSSSSEEEEEEDPSLPSEGKVSFTGEAGVSSEEEDEEGAGAGV